MAGNGKNRLPEAASTADLALAVERARVSLEALLHLLPTSNGRGPDSRSAEMLGVAQKLSRQRRARDHILGTALFGEPAWEILLELYAARIEGRRLTATSACMASGVPPTTALRWLTRLEEANLVVRSRDSRDARLSLLDLTDEGLARMAELMDLVARG